MNTKHLTTSDKGNMNHNNKMSADLPPSYRKRYGNLTQPTTTTTTTTTSIFQSSANAKTSSSSSSQSSSLSSSSLTSSSTSSATTTTSTTTANKFAPARRLAARQTLRLAIPKQQGDSYSLQNACNIQTNANSSNHQSCHQSPSQLPPAPILKRSPVTAHITGGASLSHNSKPLSASPLPLESHLLPNTGSPSPSPSSSPLSMPLRADINNDRHPVTLLTANTTNMLNMRKPGMTLSAADKNNNRNNNKCNDNNKIGHTKNNNNNFFVFNRDLASSLPLDESNDHSPIFSDLTASMVPNNSSSKSTSPTTHHLSRLFNLSPSTMRYNNMSDFSDSSHSGVVSPAASLIENFHKKTGTSSLASNNNSVETSNVSSGVGVSGVNNRNTFTSSNSGNSGVSNSNSMGCHGVGSTLSTSSLGRQNLINTSSSSSSSHKETSSTSQQVVNSSSTTTRVEKKSQRLHHVTSSSSSSSSQTSSSEMKTAALKRDLSEIKNSMSEINDLALGRATTTTTTTTAMANTTTSAAAAATATNAHLHHHQPSLNDLSSLNSLNSSDAINKLKKKIRSSIENLVDGTDEPLVTFPDGDNDTNLTDHLDLALNGSTKNQQLSSNGLSGSNKTIDTVKFEEKRTKTESKTKVVTDGFSSEQATSNLAQSKRLQAGDIDYKEAKAASAMRNRLEVDGVKAEENAAVIQEALSLRAGDVTQQSSNNVAAASIKVQSDNFSADKKAISQSQQSQTMTSNGIISQEKHVASASQSNYTMTHKGVSSSGSTMISSSSQMSATNGLNFKLADLKLDDLKALTSSSGPREIEQAISKYSNVLTTFVNTLQETKATTEKSLYLDKINEVIRRAWAVPTHGHELGYSLCNSLRLSGGLDLLMKNCVQTDMAIQFSSAQLLEQCLTTENRTHVVDHGLDKVVNVACVCTKNTNNTKTNTKYSRVGTGILEHLFKHSEGTCSDVIKLGGLDAVLFECRQNDVETLRHCASALANLSLYGGAENQEAMINRKIPLWLFPLAFHDDDNIKYYACLAIAVLVANKEIEAEVLKSGTLDLVEPFVTSHDPSRFAKSNLAHAHGQSKHWLQRLVPVLSSNREEARNLAAFHFCMEAGIKREQGNTEIFREIGAIEALKTVASCPNAIASKFAAQALRLIGETVPHKLSQQVPLWSVEDVQEWVKQIGFGQFIDQFQESQVDGDLLLKLNEENLRSDIGISNGILVKRFERELHNLKRMADYSSKDSAKMHQFLSEIGPEYCIYTYSMLNAGLDRMTLPQITDDLLGAECGIKNSIHRMRIIKAIGTLQKPSSSEESLAKTLDVFVSYRRSNGSQLASLLKVHLQLRGFTVFIDVERLEAGKFDNGLLNSIRQAKNFLLVLTPNALERCMDDEDGKDWVHREIVTALNSNCNIIPIIDQQFYWPETESLPEDMRSVCHFNGVTWIHDYQDACVDKLERFMRGEKNLDRLITMAPSTPGSVSVTYQRMHSNDSDYQSSVGGGSGGSSAGITTCNGSSSHGSGSGSGGGSGGGGGSGQAANHQANRYRQSSSPARQRIASGSLCGGSSILGSGANGGSSGIGGSQLTAYGRNSKRNLLAPYRTQPLHSKGALAIGGSMQNVSPLVYRPPRRGSAVGIYGHGKTNVSSSSFRSQSVDGLLDGTDEHDNQRVAEAAALVTAGSMALTNADSINDSTSTLRANNNVEKSSTSNQCADVVDTTTTVVRPRDKTNSQQNAHHRKSRSLDHFLDEHSLQELVAAVENEDGTQSLQNLTVPSLAPALANGTPPPPLPAELSNRDKSNTPEPLIRNNAVTRQSPEGLSSAEDDHEEDAQSRSSASSSLKSQARGYSNTESISSGGNNDNSRNHRHQQQQNNHKTSSSTSLGSNNPNNKTLFNRTLKKVRSLIKKP